MITQFHMMIGELEGFSLQHVYEEVNRLEGALAANVPTVTCVDLFSSSFSEDVRDIAFDGANGKLYECIMHST